jgi:hypothetical protein
MASRFTAVIRLCELCAKQATHYKNTERNAKSGPLSLSWMWANAWLKNTALCITGLDNGLKVKQCIIKLCTDFMLHNRQCTAALRTLWQRKNSTHNLWESKWRLHLLHFTGLTSQEVSSFYNSDAHALTENIITLLLKVFNAKHWEKDKYCLGKLVWRCLDCNDAISYETGQTGTNAITHALTQPLLPHLASSARFHVNRN